MGFFKKATASSYPARRNRINQQHHPATVNPSPAPSSNFGIQNTQSSGTLVVVSAAPAPAPAPAVTTTATPTPAAAYNPSAYYGGFPDNNNAPVQATVYTPTPPGQEQQQQQQQVVVGATTMTTAAPVVAQVYNPGNNHPAVVVVAPVQAAVYNPSATATSASASYYGGANTNNNNVYAPSPATNPMYQTQHQQGASFNNGNSNYNSNESSYWECSVCTFPNLRTEANCKGCGCQIPTGLLMSAASAAQSYHQSCQHQKPPPQDTATSYGYTNNNGGMSQMNAQMNTLNIMGGVASAPAPAAGGGGGVMRVHIPNGMLPGQKIKVRSPDGKEVVKTIPQQSEWNYDDGSKPFFRMQFGASSASPAALPASYHGNGGYNGAHQSTMAHEVPPPHSTAWRDFHSRASSHYNPPSLGSRTVPHSPRGGGAGIPPNGRHKSLIIGINYTGSRAALAGCINDARNMQGLLERNGFPNDGSHMVLLTDERARGREHQPTVENIMKAFAWFMKDVRRGDVLFFHFSGHGGQMPDKTGHEIDGYNETIIPVDFERKGQITDDVLWGSLVYNLPEGARITALMDMCHSGTGLDLPFDYNVDNRRWKADVNPAHSAGDVVLFSGCEDAQTSADVSGGFGKLAGGAMTMAFMDAYKRSPMATYHEFLYQIKKQLRKRRFSQRPQLTSSQQFDANSRIFSLGYQSSSSSGGGIPSTIEPNHNPKVGRQKNTHVRAARQGFGGGGRNDMFQMVGGALGAALLADALF